MRKWYTISAPIRAKKKKLPIKVLTPSEIYLILLYQEEYVIKQVIAQTQYKTTRIIATNILRAIEKVKVSGGTRSTYTVNYMRLY